MAKWIGVDLDGTLAENKGHIKGIGDPVKPMMDRVKKWIRQGKKVKIMTARAGDPDQIKQVKAWLKRQGLEGLPVTDRKDFDMTQLWDDKAVRVERNSGNPCSGCSASAGRAASQTKPEHIFMQTDC